MKKILVTGGAGFIGSHTVVELTKHGYNPVIVDNFSNSSPVMLDGIRKITGIPVSFHEADCTDSGAVKSILEAEGNISGIIHFAAYKAVGESVKNPLKYYRNNLGSMEVILRLMAEYRIRHLVFSSSCTIYGQPEKLPVTESSPVQPANSPYGYTKQVCEQMIKDACAAPDSELGGILLRYFNPIGAHPSGEIGELPIGVPANLVPFITQTAAGLRERITVFGNDYNTPDGTCIRDYIHVQDLAIAHIKALEWLTRHPQTCVPFNVGTGKGHSVMEIIKSFERVTGRKLNYEVGDRRAGDVEQIYASADYANKELNWKTRKSLDEALADAWRWQQKIMKHEEA